MKKTLTLGKLILTVIAAIAMIANIAGQTVVATSTTNPTPRQRAIDAIKRGPHPEAINEAIDGMSVVDALMLSNLTAHNLPNSNTVLRYSPIAYVGGKGDAAATKKMRRVYDELASDFTKETGYSLAKGYTATEIVERFYLWFGVSSDKIIGQNRWYQSRREGGGGFLPFKGNMPLRNLPRVWRDAGRCETICEWFAGILQSLGVYSLDLGGTIYASTKYDGHAAVYFYDPATDSYLFLDPMNDGLVKSEFSIYEDVFDLYSNTGIIIEDHENASSEFADITGAQDEPFGLWYNGGYDGGVIVIDGWELAGATGLTTNLPFNHGEESSLWNRWQGQTRNLVAPRWDNFGAKHAIKRAEFVAMVVQYVRSPVFNGDYRNAFSDVSNDYPLVFHLSYAAEMGWVASGEFRPDDFITRKEAATILSRAVAWSRKNGQPAKLTIDGSKRPNEKISKATAVAFIVGIYN